MKKIILQAILLIALPAILFFACKHPNAEVQPATGPDTTTTGGGNNGGGNNGGGNGPDTSLCFERDILPIFISNCAKSNCHDAASHQEGYVFTSYQTITAKKFEPGDPDDCELYEKITEDKASKRMPPLPNAPLTQQQVSLIYNWIKRGAPNTTGCSTGCDTTKFTFSGTIQPMLNQYCKGCHNSATASGGVNLDNYNGVRTVAGDGRLLGVTKRLPGFPAMPQGGNKLSDCQILQIEKWIAAGTQNN